MQEIYFEIYLYIVGYVIKQDNVPLVVIKDDFNQRKMFTSTIVFKKKSEAGWFIFFSVLASPSSFQGEMHLPKVKAQMIGDRSVMTLSIPFLLLGFGKLFSNS